MKDKVKILIWLGRVNLFISTFTFGGGYVSVPMVRRYFIEKKELFTEKELLEMAAISQATPGSKAVNLVSLAGYRVAGRVGLLISCVCALIPPLFILGCISHFYSAFITNAVIAAVLKGMQAGVAALIVDFVVDMGNLIMNEHSYFLNILAILSFVIAFFTNINVLVFMIVSCLICVFRVWIRRKRGS